MTGMRQSYFLRTASSLKTEYVWPGEKLVMIITRFDLKSGWDLDATASKNAKTGIAAACVV